jgi:hypothetical protein
LSRFCRAGGHHMNIQWYQRKSFHLSTVFLANTVVPQNC